MGKKVVFANRWVAPNGRTYKNGDIADVDNAVARELVLRGKARAHVEPVPVAPKKGEK